MPTYAYEALNAAGKPQKGNVEAVSSEEAIQQIKSQGFFPTAVREQKVKGDTGLGAAGKVRKKKKSFNLSMSIGGIKLKYLTLFTRQLSTLQDAGLRTFYDQKGAIGRRYRRQDEVGTPWCLTVDGDTLADGTVTVRDRDSMQQDRVPAVELEAHLRDRVNAWQR